MLSSCQDVCNGNNVINDPLLDLISTTACGQQVGGTTGVYAQQHGDGYQQSPLNSPLPEDSDIQALFDVDAPIPFDLDTWNDLCDNDRNLTTSVVPSADKASQGFRVDQGNISLSSQQDQSVNYSQLKRKSIPTSSAVMSSRKKRAVSKQQGQKKDLISCVIANLPQAVLEEQQKAIPTAFPSRMRQTRIQAAIKAQTDAIVQSCQQRIMKNNINDIVGSSGSSVTGSSDGNIHYIGAYTLEERRLRIARFHEKRKQRIWHHTVKYNCRRKLAVGRVRVKGRFVKIEDEK
jgi:hypothetical protein